jgi:enamine deaminase RidA (YjgF/YER057c/UK114 family)
MPNSTSPQLQPAVESDRAATAEFAITISAKPRESAAALFSRLATLLKERAGTILALFVYGDVAGREETTKVMRRFLGAIDWPVLWVEGRSCNGALVAGVQAFAIAGAEVERLLVKGRVVGTTYSDGEAQHCLLAGLGPDDPQLSREQQAFQTFENMRTALGRAGFDFADIARTWFYNEKLLDWYDAFNRVRTGYYAERPFRSGSVPASTGVEARNPMGAALAVAAWAVRPLQPSAHVAEVASPLQCPAPKYGSAFSRAMEIESGGRRRLLVSGTASIAPDGQTVWQNDITRQVNMTMEVVEAILASRGMQFSDVTRATAYFKFPLDAAVFEAWQARHRISLPAVWVHCDICRDDLLFEIELDACVDR